MNTTEKQTSDLSLVECDGFLEDFIQEDAIKNKKKNQDASFEWRAGSPDNKYNQEQIGGAKNKRGGQPR